MDSTAFDGDQAVWAYFLSVGSLGLGLPISFLSLAAGSVFHSIVHRRSPFVAFHSLGALLLGLPAGSAGWYLVLLGRLAVLLDLFLSAGHLNGDLTPFGALGAVAAALLIAEIVLGLRGAKNAEWWVFGLRPDRRPVRQVIPSGSETPISLFLNSSSSGLPINSKFFAR